MLSRRSSVWMGNGDGTFRDPKDYRTESGLWGSVCRLNVTTCRTFVINGEGDSFTTFLGNGNGTFQPGKDSGADAS